MAHKNLHRKIVVRYKILPNKHRLFPNEWHIQSFDSWEAFGTYLTSLNDKGHEVVISNWSYV